MTKRIQFTVTELEAMSEAIESRLAGETDVEVDNNALDSASSKVARLLIRKAKPLGEYTDHEPQPRF